MKSIWMIILIVIVTILVTTWVVARVVGGKDNKVSAACKKAIKAITKKDKAEADKAEAK